MDDVSISKSEKVKDLIQKTGVRILFLPLYSPDLNLVEQVCKNKHRMCAA